MTLELAQHHVLAIWRNVVISLWIDDTPVSGIEAAQRAIEVLGKEHPEGVGYLQVVCEGCQRLENDQRAAIQNLLRAGRGAIREAPVVFEGDGFRAATVRAIVAGIAAISSHGFPHRVFPNVERATHSLARSLEPRETTRFARALTEAVAEVRAQQLRKFPKLPARPKSVRP